MNEKKEALELFKSFQKLTDPGMIHLSDKEDKKKRLELVCWSNFELDFKTEGELLRYIVKKTKLLIQEL